MTPLSTKQRAAAALLRTGWEQTEVAAIVGVTDRTIRNWLTREDFTDLVDGPVSTDEPAELPTASAAPASAEPTGKTLDDIVGRALLHTIGSAHAKAKGASSEKLQLEALKAQTAAANAYSQHMARHERGDDADLVRLLRECEALEPVVGKLDARTAQLLADALHEREVAEYETEGIAIRDPAVSMAYRCTGLWLDQPSAGEWHERWSVVLAALTRDALRLRSKAAHARAAVELSDDPDADLYPAPNPATIAAINDFAGDVSPEESKADG